MFINYLAAGFMVALGVWNLLQGTLLQAFLGALCFAGAAGNIYMIVQA